MNVMQGALAVFMSRMIVFVPKGCEKEHSTKLGFLPPKLIYKPDLIKTKSNTGNNN